MSRLKSTDQVEAAASDWWHAVSRAEFKQSHDFQSQCAASRVVATLAKTRLIYITSSVRATALSLADGIGHFKNPHLGRGFRRGFLDPLPSSS